MNEKVMKGLLEELWAWGFMYGGREKRKFWVLKQSM